MFFRFFVLNRVSNLSFFVLIRVSIFQFLSKTGYLFLDDKQQNFYKLLLINIWVKRLKQKSEFCLKQGRKISDIRLKQGQGIRGRAAPPHPGIYRVPPRTYGPHCFLLFHLWICYKQGRFVPSLFACRVLETLKGPFMTNFDKIAFP